ncbi:hypothetical protein A2671_01250 [Candidatus Kaiserbacteria bacterium RIFCSPHIGHO2_01_FULL_49_13]|uniref:Uncharacterized protein n=1 Tax=Candidatus Kaiserbacteria bacterium RIFCSPHIGHO2_01_FULL_49_13 TaxID=1798477 RepID=A0A1F6CF54_9BACT|nr:MAG: hypothetical protein A2671_01250 [Candidatus Kaiserbacteria bacterium RIFCSPHIGHO2_01_FULL_49_13]
MKSFSTIPRSQGQAVITAVLFFLFGSLIITTGIVTPVVKEMRGVRTLVESKQSYFVAESSIEDVSLRLKQGLTVVSPETLTLLGVTATTAITDIPDGKLLSATGVSFHDATRIVSATLTLGTGVSFSFGLQSDIGGMLLENNSKVFGNVFSNGSIVGTGNVVGGEAISAGPTGLIHGIHATSSAYAHTIENSTIDKNAYYQTISDSTVSGTSYPGSSDQPTSSLPITDALIEQWENDALAGGTISSPCPYKITTNTTIGPKKINCDLEISTNPTVTLTGPIWVAGNISLKNNPTLQIASSLENNSVQIIADNPLNQLTGSKIEIENGTALAGNPQSYLVFISQNRSAESGGTEVAIEVQNSASGRMLLYAGHGEILLANNVSLKEVTGYKIHLKNFAEVIYETGLISLLFTAGPSGTFNINSWEEI